MSILGGITPAVNSLAQGAAKAAKAGKIKSVKIKTKVSVKKQPVAKEKGTSGVQP